MLLPAFLPDIWAADRTPDTPLAALRAEAACYLLFCRTIVDVFQDNDTLSGLELVAAEFGGTAADAVEKLACIRQQMAIDATLAQSQLEQFRKLLRDS